jgi:hypothetical protein
MPSQLTRFSYVALLLAAIAGCGPSNWEISVENKSATPVTVTVGMGTGNRTAGIKDLVKGPPQVLVAEPKPLHIQSVTIVQGADEQILKPLVELQPGQHFAIIIGEDGKATAAVK